jgi:hypothetical protein
MLFLTQKDVPGAAVSVSLKLCSKGNELQSLKAGTVRYWCFS